MQGSRYTRSSRGQSGNTNGLRGVFKDGLWLCDCTPRVPATKFQVKKEGPNKGRWFYTCQQPEGQRCKFFLWKEQAEPREQQAVLGNGRGENNPTTLQRNTNDTPRRNDAGQMLSSPPPSYAEIEARTPSHGRRRRRDEDEYEDDLTGDDIDQLMQSAESSRGRPVETPRKAIKTNASATPNSNVHFGESSAGLLTPSTAAETPRSHYKTPRASTIGYDVSAASGFPSTAVTPTPARYRDILGASDEPSLVDDVFNTLHSEGVRLNRESEEAIKHVLGKYSLRTQGIIKGREIARLGVKAKDAKIAELQLRTATLEAELEAERATSQHLRWQIETGEVDDC